MHKQQNYMTIRLLRLLILGSIAALTACNGTDNRLLSAKQATSRYDLVGGPVAYADINDFVLENDKVRVAILGTERSWGPGIFGGSLVDADIRRTDPRYPAGSGRDRFAEIFPFANLLVPAPVGAQVQVVSNGSNGTDATVRVEGKGVFLFEGLGILRRDKPILSALFADVQTEVSFRTDYTLHPGESFVTMKTWVILDAGALDAYNTVVGSTCTTPKDCGDGISLGIDCKIVGTDKKPSCVCKSLKDQNCEAEVCEGTHLVDGNGCQTCGCSKIAPMRYMTGEESVFGVILGDSSLDATIAADKAKRAGVGAGDFVFFGNQNDIFVPGHGFDEEKPIWDGLFSGRDLFAKPLKFDFVSAAGGDVSYAYFSKKREEKDPEPLVMVPVFTSAATAFITATLQCHADSSDDKTCKNARVFEFERYLAIGSGDIASVSDIVFAARGTPTGTVKGFVRWQQSGSPAVNASIFVLRNPDATKTWDDLDAVIEANHAIDGSPGVLNAVDADVGLDLQEDGDFSLTLPAGKYVLVAMDEHKVVHGKPLALEVVAGATQIVAPSLPTPALLHLSAVDDGGAALPAKATVVRLDDNNLPLYRDGGRRPYFGQGRLGIGVQRLGFAMDGRFNIALPEGKYQVVVSRGVEYGIFNKNYQLTAGADISVQALLKHEVDTTGWMGTDFHLHAEPSFDSGMPLATRVQTIAAEGVDYVASTDHDVLSNYSPLIKMLGVADWLKAVVGSEVSTLEIGHYIGFPLKYDQLDVPSHGSVDWYCKPSADIVGDILSKSGFSGDADKPTTIVAHPRDGFLGWAAQGGINAYSLTRKLSSLEEASPILRTIACDFDAMEIFNGKRFDMLHTPTLGEAMIYTRCLTRIDRSKSRAELAKACPELNDPSLTDHHVQVADLTSCPAAEDYLTCQMRYRTALARIISTEILTRTPEETTAWLNDPIRTALDPDKQLGVEESLCKFDAKSAENVDQPLETAVKKADLDRPCVKVEGVFEDYFNFLEHGFVKTVVGGSDSHGFKSEPGLPRTFVRSSAQRALDVDPSEISRNLRAGQAVTSYGPFLEVDVNGVGPGGIAPATANPVPVHVKVQTPSWFGIDRVEIYVNGAMVQAHDRDELTQAASAIVDVDKVYDVTLPVGRDSWIVVVVLGYAEDKLMRPVYLDVPFGELQLPRVAALAFSNIPVVNAVFPPPTKVPDFFPVYPMAVSNAIFIDANSNGKYDAPLPFPAFCSPDCVNDGTPKSDGTLKSDPKRKCSDLQPDYKCLKPEGRCGLDVPGVCSIYDAQTKAPLLSTH